MPAYHISELLSQRASWPCKVRGCPNPKLKHHISYCRKHRKAHQVWGHPEAGQIRVKEFSIYIPRVRKFFDEHPSEALDKIQAFFQNILYRSPRICTGTAARDFPWLPNMIRTSDNIQNRPDVLVERLCALMLYDENQRGFKNQKHQERMFASMTLLYGRIPAHGNERHWRTGAPKKMNSTRQGRLLQALGSAIWKPTGVFWIAVRNAILREDQLIADWKARLAKVV